MEPTPLYREYLAYSTARSSGVPVVLPPLENGVVVVINPNGMQNNFASQEHADAYVQAFAQRQERH